MKIAILDLGTNTFNLLIAETPENKELKIIHSSKHPVKLGKGGITRKIITEDAFARGLSAIDDQYEIINKFDVEKVYAFATSAIRDASNGEDFIRKVRDRFSLYVNIIPGEREAELIYKGVRLSYNPGDKKVLILDIGGGSNEFIIADSTTIYWKASFNLGMARLLEIFEPSDPITEEDIEKLEEFFRKELVRLFEALTIYQPSELIGSSGSFETFSSLLTHSFPQRYSINSETHRELLLQDYFYLHAKLLKSSAEERLHMPGMEIVRVEMIVLATIFVNFILQNSGIQTLIQTDFALKEGVVAEILNI